MRSILSVRLLRRARARSRVRHLRTPSRVRFCARAEECAPAVIDDMLSVPAGAVLTADVCIVGAGPAGLTLAKELSDGRRSIVMLESGSIGPTPQADELNEIESVGRARVLDQTLVRNRGLGGTSRSWSGRVAAFDALDFRHRPWVDGSGWPIDRQSLVEYLGRSLRHIGSPVADNTDPGFLTRLSGFPSIDGRLFQPYGWSYSRDPTDPDDFMRFGPRAEAADIAGVRILLNATATQLELDASGTRVRAVEVTTADGTVRTVRSDQVVLCGGAIENARLLLISDRVHPNGLGNGADLVGRYLMDHLRGPVGVIAPEDFDSAQRGFSSYHLAIGGQRTTVTPGVAVSPRAQQQHDLLNCALWLQGSVSPDDPFSLVNRVKASPDGAGMTAARVGLQAPRLLAGAWRRVIRHRTPVRLLRRLTVQCIVEQQPDRRSRVTVSNRRDRLGVRLSRVDWRVGEREARTVRWAARSFASELRRLRIASVELDPMITDASAQFHLPDVAHPAGTTRMGASSRSGVVDLNCQVFDVRGLYVCGSSVFPTSGHANPTQMIVAMAVRLADHLRSSPAVDTISVETLSTGVPSGAGRREGATAGRVGDDASVVPSHGTGPRFPAGGGPSNAGGRP